jgi:hypothetical protein
LESLKTKSHHQTISLIAMRTMRKELMTNLL